MNKHSPHLRQRTASLFRNGRNQAIRIPVEFELPGEEVLITEDGGRLIIEPKAKSKNFLDVMRDFGPLPPEDWMPEVDDSDLPPPREVDL